MTDMMDEVRRLVLPVIWDTWCVNDVSWSEIFTYLNEHLSNDVIDNLSVIAHEDIAKHTLATKFEQ